MDRVVATCLTFAVAAARSNTLDASLGVGKLGLSPSLKTAFSFEADITDDVLVGINYKLGGENPLESVYVKAMQDLGQGKLQGDFTLSIDDDSVGGDVTYSANGVKFGASLASSAPSYLTALQLRRSFDLKGLNMDFNPTYHVKTRSADLSITTDINSATKLAVDVQQGNGKNAQVKFMHKFGSSRSLQVSTKPCKPDGIIEFVQKIGKQTFTPKLNAFAPKKSSLTYETTIGKMSSKVITDMTNLKVEAKSKGGDGEWSSKIQIPWSSPSDATVTLGRKMCFF